MGPELYKLSLLVILQCLHQENKNETKHEITTFI